MAVAEVLNRDKFYGIEKEYYGGRKTFDVARMDAIMVLLAESPHPLPNDLSYQVLERDPFFNWDENPDVTPVARQELENHRQSRIEEDKTSHPEGEPDDAGHKVSGITEET